MTDTEVTADKPEVTPEQKAQRHAIRSIARTMSKLGEKGTPEEMKARWEEGKAKFTSDARKLVKALTRDGVTLTFDEANKKRGGKKGKKAGAEAEDSAED